MSGASPRYTATMSEYAQSITRAGTAGAQKQQSPPKYKEREGVQQARKHEQAGNKEKGKP